MPRFKAGGTGYVPPETRRWRREKQCFSGSACRDVLAARASLAHLPVERAAAKVPPGSTQGLKGYPDRCVPVRVQALRQLVT